MRFKKGERFSGVNGINPKCHLAKLYGKRVPIYSIDAMPHYVA